MEAQTGTVAHPHGGRLTSRQASAEDRQDLLERAIGLPVLGLNPREIADLECLAVGAFSPLEGFMGQLDYECVVEEMRLFSSLVWPLPVTLSANESEVAAIAGRDEVALTNAEGQTLAILHLEETFSYDKLNEAEKVFGTRDPAHPGVATVLAQGDYLLGGKVTVIQLPDRPFGSRRLTPQQTRREFAERKWGTVVGFQTRNPIHRAHEYLTKCALESVDGLLLHPLVGETKYGDIPAHIRMRAYETLLRNHYPRDRVILSVFPPAMRYAGPREAIFHAICRRNYGCTHFIVGRDHAGVGNYYGPLDAQKIFGQFDPDEIGITPIFFDNSFYCRACGQMATVKTCPHGEENRVSLSGTEVRRRLDSGEQIPPEFSRPEVAEILRHHFSLDLKR